LISSQIQTKFERSPSSRNANKLRLRASRSNYSAIRIYIQGT